MSLRGIILLAILLPSIPACFVRPFYGICLWTIIAFTAVQWYTWGSGNQLPWAVMVAAPTVLGFAIFSQGWNRLVSRETVLIGLLWVWFVLTSIASTHTPIFEHHSADTWIHLETVSKILLMTLVTIGVVDSFARFRTLLIVIAGCFGIFVVKSIPFLIATSGNDRIYGPPMSMIADNNDFGLALNMTLPIFFFLALSETNPWVKRVFGTLFVLTVPAIFFTYSRGALVGLAAVLGMMLLQAKQRFVLVAVLALGFLIAATFAPQAWKDRMNPSGELALDKSAQARINAWTFSWNLASDYPVAGGGFGTFTRPLFQRYAPDTHDVHGPHSIYFGILGEHGFVGLFLYLGLIASAFYSTYQVVKMGQPLGDTVAVHYARMLRFSMVGFLVSGLFLGRQYFDYYYTILACIVMLRRLSFDAWGEGRLLNGDAIGEDEDENQEEAEEMPIDVASGIRAAT